MVSNSRTQTTATGLSMTNIAFRGSYDLASLVGKAAKARGITKAAYLRRVVAVAVAADLQKPLGEVLLLGPRPTKPGEQSKFAVELDDGAGIEEWCHHPGCDGWHLRSSL